MNDYQQTLTLSGADPIPGGYRFALTHGDGQVTVSDSLTGLVTVIIPDYPSLNTDPDAVADATLARVDHLTMVAAGVQDAILQTAAENGTFDPFECDDETLTALMCDRRVAYTGGDWTGDVPLVLLATDYQPYTPLKAPTGNTILLDGATEEAFLTSLASVGLVGFLKTGGDPWAPDTHQ